MVGPSPNVLRGLVAPGPDRGDGRPMVPPAARALPLLLALLVLPWAVQLPLVAGADRSPSPEEGTVPTPLLEVVAAEGMRVNGRRDGWFEQSVSMTLGPGPDDGKPGISPPAAELDLALLLKRLKSPDLRTLEADFGDDSGVTRFGVGGPLHLTHHYSKVPWKPLCKVTHALGSSGGTCSYEARFVVLIDATDESGAFDTLQVILELSGAPSARHSGSGPEIVLESLSSPLGVALKVMAVCVGTLTMMALRRRAHRLSRR